MKLFYVILGATPEGRNIEQHDVFFGIAETLEDLIPEIKEFWKGTRIHIDCYQAVQFADGYEVKIVERNDQKAENQLFFINLGGYKPGFFEEFHEQHLMIGTSMGEIVKRIKQTDFYQNMGFKGAESHIDDKHGVDIDDIFNVHDILPKEMKEKYSIVLEKTEAEIQENEMHLGYMKLK
ncbi:DUF1543 domain-containing protein [Elizabethkingia meningoseptica]|uniref:DUF1543 domain-containing protein n=1 Tax=Elizabethkingia meningoseptica TaxID=238 RepID=UPI000332C4A3|nr:DUF1543 domain-containing protein [Elizabethkingia meningoseptica]AQX05106.1 hypothetical protein BBD33_07520 [Elizabethkingia meningoseptica]AQX47149.1 hypothetical protein B5G46_07510 [Elizabethkingia meningoseptica]EJK5329378.1 DUF1543 domain-containing protein [Elizabethkingia meningoseptica]EOR30548.1 hypothetical protein L100_05451 [Elizabethkingia meningoseptica ATCC 13253 = NBRC 12535]KUY17876.1 hypothetical protein ATB99_06385 [Elizabethkingia meningoseptica]